MLDVGYITNDSTIASRGLASQSNVTVAKPETTSNVSVPKFAHEIEVVTPRIRVDDSANLAILEYRSNKTGDLIRQFPSEGQIKAFKEAESLRVSSEEKAQVASQSVERKSEAAPVPTESTAKPSEASTSDATASYVAASNAGISVDSSSFGGSIQSSHSTLV